MSRTLRCALTLACLALAAPAQADILQTNYENALTVEPIDLLTGTFNMQFERAFAPSLSAYLGLNYLYVTGLEVPGSATEVALGPEAGIRLYLIGRAPAGLWLGPDISTAWVRNVGDGRVMDRAGLSAGGMVGLNLALGHLTGSMGIGGNFYDYASYIGTQRFGISGFETRERLALGVTF